MKRNAFLAVFVGSAVLLAAGGAYAQPQWPTFQGNAQHTGRSSSGGRETAPSLAWTYAGVYDPVIGSDGRVYCHSYDTFYALTSTGSVMWSWINPWGTLEFIGHPAVGPDDEVYVGGHASDMGMSTFFVIRWDADGSMGWEVDDEYDLNWTPVVGADGRVYMGIGENNMQVYTSTGSLLWSYGVGNNYDYHELWPPPAMPALGPNGEVYLSWAAEGETGTLACISSTGSFMWSYRRQGYYDDYSCVPTIGSDGRVYIGWDEEQSIHALTSTGSFLWSYLTGSLYYVSSPAIGSDGTVYLGSSNRLFALHSTGSLSWSYLGNGQTVCSPVIGAAGRIYVSVGGVLTSLNPDGSFVWSYTIAGVGSATSPEPALGDDGQLYVASTSMLYAFEAEIRMPVRINFQPYSSEIPEGYSRDYGQGFGAQGEVEYGWR